jgi:hypothetical protein
MIRALGILAALLMSVVQDPADPVRALVEKLAGDDVEAREQAETRLRYLGSRALPGLDAALKAADGELRVRIERAIEHIKNFGTPPVVTLEAKDRPLREIATELERQTSIPVRATAGASDLTATVSVKETILWKVVEDLCRARGDVMYRFVNDAIEIHVSKFRALPSADHGALRLFVDRFIWEGGNLNESHLRMHGGILAPRGSRLLWLDLKVEELTDDTGKNVAHKPEGGGYFELAGQARLPGSKTFAYVVAWHPVAQGAPEAAATRIACFRGVVDLVFGGDECVLASVKDPLSRPSTPLAGTSGLGIFRWSVSEYGHTIYLSASLRGDATKSMDSRCPPYPLMRLKGGDAIASWYWNLGWSPGDDIDRHEIPVHFVLPKDAVVESLDLVAPKSVFKVELPFEFKDIPLR